MELYLLLMSPQVGQEAPIGDQLTHQAHWLRSGHTSNHVDNVWVARCDPLHHLNLIHEVLLLLALGRGCRWKTWDGTKWNLVTHNSSESTKSFLCTAIHCTIHCKYFIVSECCKCFQKRPMPPMGSTRRIEKKKKRISVNFYIGYYIGRC